MEQNAYQKKNRKKQNDTGNGKIWCLEVLDARKLIRTFPQSPLIRSDSDRPGILKDFIRLVDDAYEDVLDKDVEGWLSNFKTDAIMTP